MAPINHSLAVLAACLFFYGASVAEGITFGQLDDFQDGTVQGWVSGLFNAHPPINVAGGPGGAGDAFLQVEAHGGSGPGSKLVTFNQDQWRGDYLAAGVTAIRMDIKNFSDNALTIRLLAQQVLVEPLVSDGVEVGANSGWTETLCRCRRD